MSPASVVSQFVSADWRMMLICASASAHMALRRKARLVLKLVLLYWAN